MNSQERMKAGIGWFKKNFAADIAAATQGMPFHLDFLTAIAIQETFELWGRCFDTKPVAEVLKLCVGDTLDASGGRNKTAFPQNRAVLERAPDGKQMFQIARQALFDMAQVATEYKKIAKNQNKFCHAFGIFQYDIQAFLHDKDYFLDKEWGTFSKALGKALMELHEKWGSTFPGKKTLTDKQLVLVAIAYNQGHVDINKGFKQGFKAKGEKKFYGELIDDYMTLSKATPPAP